MSKLSRKLWWKAIRSLFGTPTTIRHPGRHIRPTLETLEDRTCPSTLVVTTAADVVDPDDGVLSLREAIATANAAGDEDTIQFDLPADQAIVLDVNLGGLPTITGPVILDGTTNTEGHVVLDGNGVAASAFVLTAGSSTVRGFDIVRFGDHAIVLQGGTLNVIEQNVIGRLSTTAEFANGGDGVHIVGSARNTIRNNSILQNEGDGIEITGNTAEFNRVEGNTIQFNEGDGVAIRGADQNTIGGTDPEQSNNISRQVGHGVVLSGSVSRGNKVLGNVIGLDENRIDELGNFGNGVLITNGAQNNTIGAPTGGLNLISGNRLHGVAITGGSENNQVANNVIGLDGDGTSDPQTGFIRVPNQLSGVFIEDSANNTIGGDLLTSRNVISGNALHGVHISGEDSSGNTLKHNLIGTDPNNIAQQRNAGHGVFIEDAPENHVGGSVLEGNIIAGNGGDGVRIAGATARANQVQGNIFGASTQFPLANAGRAIAIIGAPENLIGGDLTDTANEIAGGRGILIRGADATGNRVQGNFLGTDSNHELFGDSVQGNLTEFGIALEDAPDNLIGGTTAETRNFIANLRGVGILLTGTGTTGNQIQGNRLGVESDDATAAPGFAMSAGIVIENGASDNQIGGTASNEGNVIGFPRGNGIEATSGTGNSLLGNRVFGSDSLAIDLNGDGPTLNDPLDGDNGPNQLQNAPAITSVIRNGGDVTIEGVLESRPNTSYRLEFFANPEFRALAAEVLLGSTNVTTDGNGLATFNVTFTGSGVSVSATATDPNGNTSEMFDRPLIVNTLGDEADADPEDGSADVDLATPGEQITLRSALQEAERRAGTNRITFAIPVANAGDVPILTPGSALPTITQGVVIDARTQPGSGQIILDGESAGFSGIQLSDGLAPFEVTLAGLEIRGFTTGIRANAANASLTLAGVNVHNNTLSGLFSVGFVEITQASRFNNNGEAGINMEGEGFLASDEVDFIEANENGSFGIRLAAAGGAILHNVTATLNESHGINTRSSNLRMTGNNDISDNRGHGILSVGGRVEVEHLKANNNDGNGVIAGSVSLLFGGNTVEISDNGENGILLDGSGGLAGFALAESVDPVASIDINRNQEFGILQQGNDGPLDLQNVRIDENQAGGIRTPGAVFISGSGNSISRNNGDAILSFQRDVEIEGETLIEENAGAGIFSRSFFGSEVQILRNGNVGIDVVEDITLTDSLVCGNQPEEVAFGGTVTTTNSIICSTEVTNADDAGFGSLRNAVLSLALRDSPATTITFNLDPEGPATHTLNLLSELRITHNVTILGPGANRFIIDGGGNTRLFSIIEETDDDIDVEIRGLTLRNGNGSGGDGGAIFNQEATLELREVILEENQANRGGAIYSIGEASGGDDGYGGYGGGEYGGGSGESRLIVTESTLKENEATDSDGGAIWTSSNLEVSESTLSQNVAADDGGAIYLASDFADALSGIEASTLHGNEAENGDGGAVWAGHQFSAVNTTISDNTADSQGGGIHYDSSSASGTLAHVTLTQNTADTGGGLSVENGVSMFVFNTIVAGNVGGDLSGELAVEEANLIGGDPLLGPLQNNGGTTFTHAPQDGSLAIDTGNRDAGFSLVSLDQRGFRRDVLAPDIGAYELVFDYGDAPASFPVTLEQDGARHVVGSLFLGRRIDNEGNGQPSDDAQEDDANGVRFDDDGVVFGTAVEGFQARLGIIASGPGLVSAWIDFNANGNWFDPGEQILADVPVVAGNNRFAYPVPDLENPPARRFSTIARVRLSTQAGLDVTGAAPDGEVEDHPVTVEAPILPNNSGGGSGRSLIFTRNIEQRQPAAFDPDIAVGYVYEVSSGPNFATLELLPGFGDDAFTLGIDDGSGGFTDVLTFTAGDVIDFERHPDLLMDGGLTRFRITGIEVAANVDPDSPLAFPTVLSFVDDGQVTFSQTPLTEFINTPPTAADDEASVKSNGILDVPGPGLLDNDGDTDPENLALVVTAVNGETTAVDTVIQLPSGALLQVRADGSFTYNPNGAFAFLNAGESTTDSFCYTVTDTHGGSDEATVTVTIHGAVVWRSLAVAPPLRVSDYFTGDAQMDYVRDLYIRLLGRQASSQEAAAWVQHWNQVGNHVVVVSGVFQSPEHRMRQVAHYYQSILGRLASANEVLGWASFMLNGMSEDTVILSFLLSPEFLAGKDPTAYATSLYRTLLFREPEPDGLAGWVAALNGGLSQAQVALAFLHSREYGSNALDDLYRLYLHRAPDPQGHDHWLRSFLSRNISETGVILGFLLSPEFLTQVRR